MSSSNTTVMLYCRYLCISVSNKSDRVCIVITEVTDMVKEGFLFEEQRGTLAGYIPFSTFTSDAGIKAEPSRLSAVIALYQR